MRLRSMRTENCAAGRVGVVRTALPLLSCQGISAPIGGSTIRVLHVFRRDTFPACKPDHAARLPSQAGKGPAAIHVLHAFRDTAGPEPRTCPIFAWPTLPARGVGTSTREPAGTCRASIRPLRVFHSPPSSEQGSTHVQGSAAGAGCPLPRRSPPNHHAQIRPLRVFSAAASSASAGRPGKLAAGNAILPALFLCKQLAKEAARCPGDTRTTPVERFFCPSPPAPSTACAAAAAAGRDRRKLRPIHVLSVLCTPRLPGPTLRASHAPRLTTVTEFWNLSIFRLRTGWQYVQYVHWT
jgi:hypothetical protein